MRQDSYFYNDAGGWSVVVSEAVSRIVADDRTHDDQFVQAYEAALFCLEGDDYSVIRVVVDEPLTDLEAAEWVARARWRLNLQGNQMVISSGFDPDVLYDWQQEGNDSSVQAIDLPPGDYQVTLYTYLHSMNGAIWLNQDGSKFPPLSQWFRQDYPGRPLPTWVAANFAYDDLNLDPTDEWYPFRDSVKTGRVTIEQQPLHWIGYLVHIIPFTAEMELDQPGTDSWFDTQTGLRVPSRCPLGIPTDCTEDGEVASRLEWVLEP